MDLGRILSGKEAYDFVITSLDPVKYDIMSLGSKAMSNFGVLQLTSIQTGSFTKFLTKWNTSIEQLKANKMAMATHDIYLKVALFNKLPHEAYKHIFLTKGQLYYLNITETQAKIGRIAIHVKRAEGKMNTKNQSKNDINNSLSNSSISDKKGKDIPGTIGYSR